MEGPFKHCGRRVMLVGDEITVDMGHYIDGLELPFSFSKDEDGDRVLEAHELGIYEG